MTDEPLDEGEGPDWLSIADESFRASTNYIDSNWRKPMERNIALFQSRHPSGSKYNGAAYKGRSRLFRPKTKSVVRKNEAAAVAAFFSNVDVVTIDPENDADISQVAGADLMNELVNYRLTKTIPWFVTLVGAVQEAQVIGIVASYQYWDYKEKPGPQTAVADDQGQPLMDEQGQQYMQAGEPEVTLDEPCIDLIPFENLRFDPGAKWTDIVGSSPYLIRMVPMYVDDVKQMMKDVDSKTGQAKWKNVSEQEIRSAMVDYDTIRQAREGLKQDPKADNNAPFKEFEIVWCHENFIRKDGEEVVYWTLGTQHLLSDPIPLKEAYFHNQRPIVIGCCVLEAHKAVPDSLVSIGSELQKEVNETVNQRRDNVSLVLNKRYFVKRGKGVDVDSLLRNVAGAATLMDDPATDVVPQEWNDVTASSYQEQDRLNVDYDELTGNFSQSSVQTNRKLNETVGGMQMMGGSANQMTEYLIRTFVETWVEPVLRQLVLLEKEYETDGTLLQVCGGKAALAQKYQLPPNFDLLKGPMSVRVNVGMGATDPHQKMNKFMFALQTYGTAMRTLPDADPQAIRREIFGLAGYKDGSRFFQKDDPKVIHMQQQMQQMGQQLQQVTQELESVKMDKQAQMIKAQADSHRAGADAALAAAQIDKTEAETVKTLVEAGEVPSEEMELRAQMSQEAQERSQALIDAMERLTESHAQMRELVGGMQASQAEPKQDHIAEALHRMADMQGQTAEALHKMTRPKKLIFDDHGEPIGVTVD